MEFSSLEDNIGRYLDRSNHCLNDYQSRCYYDCQMCPNPVCINNKCQSASWKHSSGYADIMPHRAELKNRSETSFHYDFQDDSLFVEAINFRKNTLSLVIQEIENIANKGKAQKIRIFIVGRAERWPYDYSYSYMGYRQAMNHTNGAALHNLFEHIYHKDILDN